MHSKEQLAEQLLVAEKQYAKGHTLKTRNKPSAEEKQKAARQREAIRKDLKRS